LKSVPLTAEEYKNYGDVIECASQTQTANQGSAQRSNWMSSLVNLRKETAKLNICIFKCQPRSMPFHIKLLERHQFSTQIFIPMTAQEHYLVIVALGNEQNPNIPDLSTIKAFLAKKDQGISYHPGIWHHPMIALENETVFTCLVHEDGSNGDTHIVPMQEELQYIVEY